MIEYQMVFINGIPHLARLVNKEIVKGIADREVNGGKV